MAHHHDLAYFLIATLLAVFGSWTSLDLFRRAQIHDGSVQMRWVGASALAMGVSIWSMHFVAMLGFDPGSPVSYDLGLTALSLVLAVGGTSVAFALCAQPSRVLGTFVSSGLVMGLSIAGMHYVGMAALRTASLVAFHPGWVFASLIVAVVASLLALAAARWNGSRGWRALAAVILGLGIVAMHYTAMAAVTLTSGQAAGAEDGVPPLWVAFGVASLTLVLLFLGLMASLLDQKLALLLALRAGRMGYWEMDIRRRRLKLSEEGRVLLGFAPGDPFDQSMVSGLMTEASAQNRSRRLETAILEGAEYEADYEMLDGRWLEIRGRMIMNGQGRSQRLVGTIQDVTAHRAAFQALARSEARQRVLINELNHRVKNTLATIQSIASLTARKAESVQTFADAFQARLLSLSATHNLLTLEAWERAEVRRVFEAEFGHYDEEQIRLDGPEVWLKAETVLALGLVVHELATNAAKYGALSRLEGRVLIRWSSDAEALSIAWRESQGPRVSPPQGEGFGTRLIRMSASQVTLRYAPEGFEADIRLPLTTNRLEAY